MNSPRICSADARGGDATARVKLRAGATERLARPKELPKPFHEAYGDPFGYQFTWGQIIEEPNFVPDPATERYDGRMWRPGADGSMAIDGAAHQGLQEATHPCSSIHAFRHRVLRRRGRATTDSL